MRTKTAVEIRDEIVRNHMATKHTTVRADAEMLATMEMGVYHLVETIRRSGTMNYEEKAHALMGILQALRETDYSLVLRHHVRDAVNSYPL